MAVVIDEVQVEAVEAQAREPHEAHGQAQKPGKPKLDPIDLAIALRRRDQRFARLWAD